MEKVKVWNGELWTGNSFYIHPMKLKEPITAKQIAAWTNSELIGDENAQVKGLNEIHNVEDGDITFVDHEKYYDFTIKSKASFTAIARLSRRWR